MMMRITLLSMLFFSSVSGYGLAQEKKEYTIHDKLMDHGDGHMMDMGGGMVMGQNTSTLPGGCDKISGDQEITVHAGHKYSKKFPGTMFSFDQQEWKFDPCTRVTVHFVNEDDIRHQFMIHGLPKYIYKSGMFHLEATGPAKISGTFILPGYDQTYLVHCDIAQHMEKGMKGQIVVGKGGIPIPSIPGVNPQIIPDSYSNRELITVPPPPPPPLPTSMAPGSTGSTKTTAQPPPFLSGMSIIGLALGLWAAWFFEKRYRGKNRDEIMVDIQGLMNESIKWIVNTSNELIQQITGFIRRVTQKS